MTDNTPSQEAIAAQPLADKPGVTEADRFRIADVMDSSRSTTMRIGPCQPNTHGRYCWNDLRFTADELCEIVVSVLARAQSEARQSPDGGREALERIANGECRCADKNRFGFGDCGAKGIAAAALAEADDRALANDAAAWYSETQREEIARQSPDGGREVDDLARILAPFAFKSWDRMVEHCLASGDSQELAEKYATDTYGGLIDQARVDAKKAIDWFALTPPADDVARTNTDVLVEALREAPAPAEPLQDGEVRDALTSVETAAKALLDACYQADAAEELPFNIDGSLLDALSDALDWRHPIIWTDEQVAALNAYQAGPGHPFTCGGNRTDAVHIAYADAEGGDYGQLIATRRGWICPVCEYRQNWAHAFMFEGAAPDPRKALSVYGNARQALSGGGEG